MARSELFLNQGKYSLELIDQAGRLACKPSFIPTGSKQQLALSTAGPLSDPTTCRSLVGHLLCI